MLMEVAAAAIVASLGVGVLPACSRSGSPFYVLRAIVEEQRRPAACWHGRCAAQVYGIIDPACSQNSSAAYVLKRDSANDITITQMFITLAIMLEVY